MSLVKVRRVSRTNIAAVAVVIIVVIGGLLATIFFREPVFLFNALGLSAVVVILLIVAERVAINIRNAVGQIELSSRN